MIAKSLRSPMRVGGFNVCHRARTNRADACWRRYWHRGGFPGSNGLDYDVDSVQCAFDFTLHALNLGLQECLQLLEFGR
jgi:hypothetical protein